MTPSGIGPIRFGSFELNPETGELRRQGLKVKLGNQAARLLQVLLETPGQLRTREELQRQLWPENTFVDFEHSLNKAIHALREALGDAAGNPRFIETVAAQGYRFIVAAETPNHRPRRSRTLGKIRSMAVLPIATVGDNPDAAFLGSRITSRMIDALSVLPGVRVLAESTVKSSGPLQEGPRRTGERLGVEGVVVGEISHYNDDLLLHVELIDTYDGAQLCGVHLERSSKSLMQCSDDVVDEIVRQMRPIVAPSAVASPLSAKLVLVRVRGDGSSSVQ